MSRIRGIPYIFVVIVFVIKVMQDIMALTRYDKTAALAYRGLREKASTHVEAFPSSIKVKIIINYPVACMLIRIVPINSNSRKRLK